MLFLHHRKVFLESQQPRKNSWNGRPR